MAAVVPDILARFVEQKRASLARLKPRRAELERRAADRAPARDFQAALIAHLPAIVAEVKQASPSKGVFTGDFQPAARRPAC